MIILSKKKVDEILKRITACQIIADAEVEDIESYVYMTENLATIATEVGGPKGCMKVINTLKRRSNNGD